MKKYFVVADVHSFYDELIEALEKAGFDSNNPDHIFISCGDLCDRGSFPVKCLNFAMDLYNKGRAILIKGNHEDLMEEAISRHYFESHDYHNRTTETAEYITGKSLADYGDEEILKDMKTNELWNSYINATIDYKEIGDYIFVHGWIPITECASEEEQYKNISELYRPTDKRYNPKWRKPLWYIDWEEARWLNGMNMWYKGIREPGKTIVCGHYHTSWGHSRLHNDGVEWLSPIETYYIDPETGKQEPHMNTDIFYDDGIIALDGCTALSHKVNVAVLENLNE